ncbi:MAG: hypothetical protein SFY56_15540 [Bacteroidota bacterium]|nr:hypothetical protein [Bacteroidota bacterium]
MGFEEQFDKIINKKMNEAEFPFDEKNWEKANGMIEANRITSAVAKNKSKYFLFLGLLFVALTSIGTFVYLSMDSVTKVTSANIDKKSTTELENVTVDTKNSLDNLKNQELTYSSNSAKYVAVTKANNQNNSIIENKSLGTTENKGTAKKPENNSENNKTKNVISDKNPDDESLKEMNDAKTIENTNSKETFVNKSNTVINEKSEINNALNALKTSKKSEQIGNGSKILAVLESKQTNSEVSLNTERKSDNILQSDGEVSSNDTETSTFEYMHSTDINSVSENSENECKNLNANFLSVYDNDYYKNTKPKFHYLNLEAGDMYLFGWNVSNGKDATGFNYYAGINYGLYINSKTEISIGAQGYNIGNIKQSFYSGSNTSYGFGSTGTYTNITTNALYYLNIPVKYSYSVTKKDKIGLGVNAGFIVGGKNTIETYKLSDGVKSNLETVTQKGYYEGVNTKNFTISAFYSHKLYKRFALNGEFVYGLSDIYINTKSNYTKQNIIGLRLGLVFTLFDK